MSLRNLDIVKSLKQVDLYRYLEKKNFDSNAKLATLVYLKCFFNNYLKNNNTDALKYRSQLYESEEKSKDDDSIPDSFGSSDNQDNNSTRDNTDSSSEDSYINITKNSVLTIDYSDSITTENNLIITNENQNTNLTIDSCDSITNEKQYTEIEKIKLQPNIDNISHIKLKSNITALAFFPYLLVILTLTLSILITKIINRHNLKDIIYHSTNTI